MVGSRERYYTPALRRAVERGTARQIGASAGYRTPAPLQEDGRGTGCKVGMREGYNTSALRRGEGRGTGCEVGASADDSNRWRPDETDDKRAARLERVWAT